MKKVVIIFLLVLFLTAVIKIVFPASRNQWTDYLKIPDFIQWYSPNSLTPPIYGEKSIRQDFRPNFDGLMEIGLPFLWEKVPFNVLVSLYKGEKPGHLIFEREFFSTDLHKGKMFRFRFKPIIQSKNEYFSLVVKAPGASLDNNIRLYYGQRVFHISCRGPLYFDEQKIPGELSLTANCRYDIREGIFTWAREKIRKDKIFFLSFGLMLLAVSGTAIFYTMSLRPSTGTL